MSSGLTPTSKAEWHPLREIMVHQPGAEVVYSLLSPKEHLYGGPISLSNHGTGLFEQHANVLDTYRGEGVKIHMLQNLVLSNPSSRIEAKNIVMKSLHKAYGRSNLYTQEDLSHIESHADKIIDGLPPEFLWQVLATNPELSSNYKNGHEDARYSAPKIELQVAGNLFYMRDQQFTTDRGVVMGGMKFEQRRYEPNITRLAFEQLGIRPILEIDGEYSEERPTFEGGDFIPAGDFALIGVGDRTNETGSKVALKNGALGFDQVVVIYQPSGQHIMHLDTYFNIIDDGLCTADRTKLTKKVNVFDRDEHGYKLSSTTTLEKYLAKKGFSVVGISPEEQKRYVANFITLGKRKIMAPEIKTILPDSDYQKRLEREGVDVIPLDVSELTQGYGGIHCLTCVLKRG
ncbi:hypothetical protein EPN87_04605 [archaeon]|nr:MAG: hypothetical protein EPN87_04605 [archaeon]